MSKKLITAIVSLAAIILIVVSFLQRSAGNYIVSIVTGVAGIVLAVVYCIMSLPEIREDLKILKGKNDAGQSDEEEKSGKQ